MRIAYVTRYDAGDTRAWSGAGHHVARALESQGAILHYVGRLAQRRRRLLRLKQLALARIGVSRLCDREPSLIKAYADDISRRLPPRCDVIFATSTLPIADLECDPPTVFWTDATFAGMLDYYPEFSGLPAALVAQGHRVEQAALQRCGLAIYTSEWAAASAVRDYGADPEKVTVVPFGSNVTITYAPGELDRVIAARASGPCRLLFVGRDWDRKGGDLAVRIAAAIHRRSVPVELNVVGCTPIGAIPAFVNVHGYISKNDSAGRARLNQLFSEARFLVLPSRAECNANVFAEACAFGVPVLATQTGGVSTSVKDGVNGRTFAPSAGPAVYADYIQDMLAAPTAYRELATGAHEEYRHRLNWGVAAATVLRLLEQCVQACACAERGPHAAAPLETAASECAA